MNTMKILFLSFSFFVLHSTIGQELKIYSSNEVDVFPILEIDGKTGNGTEEKFQNQIKYHVTQTFKYPIEALEKRLHGKAYVRFLLDSTGRVSKVQGRSKEEFFEKEAVRIFEALPKAEPAQVKGKNVAFVYNWPIAFNLEVEGKQPILEIEPKTIKSVTELISYDKVAAPPVFAGCEKAKNQKKCFDEKLSSVIKKSKNIKLNNSQELLVKATVYFEIDKNSNLSNIVTIASFPDAKLALERYLKSQKIIVEAAKNNMGEPVACFYATELNLKAVGRTKRGF